MGGGSILCADYLRFGRDLCDEVIKFTRCGDERIVVIRQSSMLTMIFPVDAALKGDKVPLNRKYYKFIANNNNLWLQAYQNVNLHRSRS